MFIIFCANTKQIMSYGFGTPTESGNKLYLGDETICRNLNRCSWKTITDQYLEQDEFGVFVHDADHYQEISPEPSLTDLEARITALEALIEP